MMNNRGFLPAIPVVVWVLGLLGVGAGVMWFQGVIYNAITAGLLILIGLFLFGKFIDSLAFADSAIMPILLFIMSASMVVFGLYTFNPGIFAGLQLQALVGMSPSDTINPTLLAQSPFEPVPIAQSTIAQLSPIAKFVVLASILFALYLIIDTKAFKKK